MDDAIAAIRNAKARYWRGVDLNDGDLVRSILAEDCVLDYHGCCTDPVSGVDFLPSMNVTMRGRDSWVSGGLAKAGIISVHQGHQADIELTSADSATGIWAFTDRFFVPSGKPFSRLTGYGHYHETYTCLGGAWQIKTLRITRIWVEVE
jgi:SnoaL-like domain